MGGIWPFALRGREAISESEAGKEGRKQGRRSREAVRAEECHLCRSAWLWSALHWVDTLGYRCINQVSQGQMPVRDLQVIWLWLEVLGQAVCKM